MQEKATYSNKIIKIISFIIATLPIAAHIKLPGISMGLGSLLICAFAVFVFFIDIKPYFILKFRLLSVCLFFLYSAYKSLGNNTQLIVWIVVLFWVLTTRGKFFDIIFGLKIATNVACIASIGVLLQQLIHAITGTHLMMMIPYFMLPYEVGSSIYTGMGNGQYRPSAFFLEPSHMALYCMIPLLASLLFYSSEIKNLKKAIIISVGLIACTSSLGICVVFGAWFLFGFLGIDNSNGNIIVLRFIYIVIFGIVILVGLKLPIVSTAILRLVGESNGYNAINGRLVRADIINHLSTEEKIWGKGYAHTISGFTTGYARLVYYTGYVGFALFILSILSIIQKNRFSICLSVFYAIFIFFGDPFSVSDVLFMMSFIGAQELDRIGI